MVININPNRINVSGGASSKTSQQRQQETEAQQSAYVVPKRSDINFIPAAESLRTLISSAVASLRKGVYWDRGTILNLIV